MTLHAFIFYHHCHRGSGKFIQGASVRSKASEPGNSSKLPKWSTGRLFSTENQFSSTSSAQNAFALPSYQLIKSIDWAVRLTAKQQRGPSIMEKHIQGVLVDHCMLNMHRFLFPVPNDLSNSYLSRPGRSFIISALLLCRWVNSEKPTTSHIPWYNRKKCCLSGNYFCIHVWFFVRFSNKVTDLCKIHAYQNVTRPLCSSKQSRRSHLSHELWVIVDKPMLSAQRRFSLDCILTVEKLKWNQQCGFHFSLSTLDGFTTVWVLVSKQRTLLYGTHTHGANKKTL